MATIVASSPVARASIGSDKSRITQLEQEITAQGERIQVLVGHYDHVEATMLTVQKQIGADRRHILSDHEQVDKAVVRLRTVAIDAYVNASSGNSVAALSMSSTTSAQSREVYLGVASGSLDQATAALQLDRHRTSVDESSLQAEQGRLKTTLTELASAKTASEAAIATDQSILQNVSANLRALVAAAIERREAAERAAAERREAAAAAALRQQEEAAAAAAAAKQHQQQQDPPPPPPVHNPSPGSYGDPLRAISGLTPERIDMGVDYSGVGNIYAVGDGVVLNTVNGGWPGGTFIAYRLTDGPASGLVVYAAEDIQPLVQVGQTVSAGTAIGQMYEGPDGIETGWADGNALGDTMAATYGQFSGANSTAFGANFSQLLEALGAPGGILQNSPPTGSLPAGWPEW